jgi:Asp-tRNA(Asn)/Glu-tRNA(Gln) amidotransferase C subunit
VERAHKRPFTPFTTSELMLPPSSLPEATTLRELGLPFTETELTHIRTAMALHAASRQPQLTYDGWKVIEFALNIGEVAATRHAKGVVHSRGKYGDALRKFLNATGFAFANKGMRYALREIIKHLDEVNAWHEDLIATDRAHLHNPIDVWDRFREDQAADKPRVKRQRPVTKQRRGYPSVLEELQALQDALEASEERSNMLDMTLDSVLESVPPDALKRLPDELLRKVFARLPQKEQDAPQARLLPEG